MLSSRLLSLPSVPLITRVQASEAIADVPSVITPWGDPVVLGSRGGVGKGLPSATLALDLFFIP